MTNARKPVQVRMSDTGLTRLDAIATEWGVTRSDVIRAILGQALTDKAWLKTVRDNLREKI